MGAPLKLEALAETRTRHLRKKFMRTRCSILSLYRFSANYGLSVGFPPWGSRYQNERTSCATGAYGGGDHTSCATTSSRDLPRVHRSALPPFSACLVPPRGARTMHPPAPPARGGTVQRIRSPSDPPSRPLNYRSEIEKRDFLRRPDSGIQH